MTSDEKRARKAESSRRWRARNPEKAKEVNLRYRRANREKLAAAAYAWRQSNPGKTKEAARRWREANVHRHAMSRAEWFQILAQQDGLCYLCNKPLNLDSPREVHVDHDHRCCQSAGSCRYCRRGLACRACNGIIGFASDDPATLRLIADNLEAAIAHVSHRLAGKPDQAALFDDLEAM
jgi:hypothetical protein